MARAEGDHFAENAYAFPRRRDCGDDILGASGHADSAPPLRVANGRSSRQRVRPQPIPGTGRGVPFVWAWSLSGWILWVARGKRLPTRLLAWPVGSLPQHAVPREASGRIVVLGRYPRARGSTVGDGASHHPPYRIPEALGRGGAARPRRELQRRHPEAGGGSAGADAPGARPPARSYTWASCFASRDSINASIAETSTRSCLQAPSARSSASSYA